MKEKFFQSVFFRKRKIIIPLFLLLILMAGTYVYIMKEKNKVFKNYKITHEIEIDSNIQSEFIRFKDGVLRCSNDGISFYKDGKEVFNKAIQMSQPIVDVRGSYIVVAERKTSNICLIDEKGNQSNITATHSIVNVTVSEQGVVAAILDDGKANYIELYDKNGAKLVSGRTVLEGDGYPVAISLSKDATKLVASYLAVAEGQAQSKVVFYNYSSVGENEVDRIVGGFNQYKDSIVPEVRFLDNTTAVVVGDNMFTIYHIDQKPSIEFEQNFNNKVETVFYGRRYFGIVYKSDDQSYEHEIRIYDKSGDRVFTKGTNFNYKNIAFAGENIVMNDSQTCLMYSFRDKERFNEMFDKNIIQLVPVGERKLILVSDNVIEEIELK